MPSVLSFVLAGGEGKRLMPLTLDRAKPAVPFGGHYRLVDFVLSNLANAGFLKIIVLTQYKSHSLDIHLSRTWRMSALLGHFVSPVPAQMRLGQRWFSGSADAVYQNLNIVGDVGPDYICVFGADHIYRMDPRQMLAEHIESGAGVTVAGIRVPAEQSAQFGVIEVGEKGRIHRFVEKPDRFPGLADAPDQIMASMGNYIFTTETLVRALHADANDEASNHDMGGDLIPALVREGVANVYDFGTGTVPGVTGRDASYWRDVGTLDSYYDAHMDLVAVHPVFNLYNRQWPIMTSVPALPPAKFVFEDDGRRGQAHDSLVSPGVIISGGTVRRSIISPEVLIEPGALVENSVVMDQTVIGAGAVVRRAILDKAVHVEPGAQLGLDPARDRQRHTVSEAGVVVVGKGTRVAKA